MNFIVLFKYLFVSHLKQQKLSVLFAIISIILGVSVFVTLRLTSTNILNSFKSSTHYISGQNFVQINSLSPISESLIPELVKIPSVDAIIPVSTRFVKAYSGGTHLGFIQLVGIDILALNQMRSGTTPLSGLDEELALFLQDRPVNVLISKQLLSQLNNAQLSIMINNEAKPLTIQGLMDNNSTWGDMAIIVDIKNYQDLFNEYGQIEQIQLSFSRANSKAALAQVAAILPPSLSLEHGNENSQYAEDLTSTYQFNLNFLNCLALLVSAMILYNAISHYVLERRRDFGMMLILGAQASHLFFFTLTTTLVLALICSLAGLALGYLITSLSLNYIVQNFSQLFIPLSSTEVHFPLSLALEVLGIVTLTALLVSIMPCLEAYKTPALQTTFYQTYEQKFQGKITKFTVIGLILLLLSLLAMLPAALKWSTTMAYVSLLGILLGTAFLLPLQLKYVLGSLRRLLAPHWLEARMAIEHIQTTARKNVVAIAAMSITISLYLSCTILIDSTRATCSKWVNHVLSADVYINAKPSTFAFQGGYLSSEAVDFIMNNPTVTAVNLLRHKDLNFNNKSLRLIGMEFPLIGTYYKLPLMQNMTKRQQEKLFADPNNILISEHLAHEFNYHIGDSLIIPGEHGPRRVRIANIFYNYANYQNIILVSNPLFSQLYEDPRIEAALLYLKQPTAYTAFLNSFKEAFPELNLPIHNQIEIKNIGFNMMDQTFKISKAIILAIFVLTALTLFNVLEQLILSRRHEFTVFWALGTSDLSLIKMCLWESLIIYIAAALSSILPTILGLSLIFKFLTQFLFGVHIDLLLSYSSISSFFLLLAALVILDGLLPALKIRKFINAKGLRYE